MTNVKNKGEPEECITMSITENTSNNSSSYFTAETGTQHRNVASYTAYHTLYSANSVFCSISFLHFIYSSTIVSIRRIIETHSQFKVISSCLVESMEDCGENNMYWWSDIHPKECRWGGICTLHFLSYIQDIHIQTHRSNLLQQMVGQI